MPDVFSPDKRRRIMQAVRRQDTKPEQSLASALRRAGIKFLQHHAELPGRPDFYFPAARTVAFVHGCFWHGHEKCRKGRRRPKSNRRYWIEKIERNRRRDRRVARKLRSTGMSVFTVWECELKSGNVPRRLMRKLEQLLGTTKKGERSQRRRANGPRGRQLRTGRQKRTQ